MRKLRIGDVVTILVAHPSGLDTKVKGLVGVVTERNTCPKDSRVVMDYRVKTSCNAYWYHPEEIRSATAPEIRAAFANLVAPRRSADAEW